MFQRTLHVEASLAEALEREGFTSLDEVAYVPHGELAEATGLDPDKTQALRNLARMYLLNDALSSDGESERGGN